LIKPFRWNLARREQLGGLLDGEPVVPDAGFQEELRHVSARIVARTIGCRLIFVGRSPENFFDYLSGIFFDVESAPPLTLLQFSNRYAEAADLAQEAPMELRALHVYFELEKIDPESIVHAASPIWFIDLVAEGGTFANLFGLMKHWSTTSGADWMAVKKKIGFLGLTSRRKNSPNTWRWWQHHEWTKELTSAQISNVSLSPRFWSELGNTQAKVTPSHPRHRWADERSTKPTRHDKHLDALRMAAHLFREGATSSERTAFSRVLTDQEQMSDRDLRALVLGLKHSSPV